MQFIISCLNTDVYCTCFYDLCMMIYYASKAVLTLCNPDSVTHKTPLFILNISPLSGNSRRSELPQRSQSCIDQINSVCEMYLQLLSLIAHLSSEILIGLGCNEAIMYKMWCLFRETTKLQIKMIIGVESRLSNVFSLFCQMMLYMLV